MIKKWIEFNESKSRGSKINAKMDLLKDLSLELSDMGLEVEIWSGSGSSITGKHEDDSKFIIMLIDDTDSILDEDGYYENELQNKKEILDFEETLKSYEISPRIKNGFSDKVYFYFDKQGKMTDSDLLK